MQEFRRVRDLQDAIFFYVLYLFPFLLVRLLIFGATALFTRDPVYSGLVVGNLVAAAFCFLLGVMILRAKRHVGNVRYWSVLLLGVLGALAGGAVVGLVPIAFLTTRNLSGSGYSEGEWQRETKVPLEDL